MGTEVVRDPRLDEEIHVFRSVDEAAQVAERVFHGAQLLVIDGIDWPGMDLVRANLVPVQRAFKDPFQPETKIAPEIAAALDAMGGVAEELAERLYPGLKRGKRHGSYRPMISGPEPMHFDTYRAPEPWLTSFMNLSGKPRTYRVSYSFPALVKRFPVAMRDAADEAHLHSQELSYALRDCTQANKPPLDDNAPRHTVHFAPGSIWFFDAKLVSHEVVYGEGAVSFSWPSRGKVQADYMRDIGR